MRDFHCRYRVIFLTAPFPLFSTKVIKGQVVMVNLRLIKMKVFMEQELRLAPWHYLISALNRGRGWAEQETIICIPVPAVPVQDIWQEKKQKISNSLN